MRNSYEMGDSFTFSKCTSSPLENPSISSAFFSKTVPLVSVWAMSSPLVKTATFALYTFLTAPRGRLGWSSVFYLFHSLSGSLPKTIPFTTLLVAKLPPIIFTTRTLSTLKFLGFGGITASAASDTSDARVSSKPYCFDAMAGLSAASNVDWVNGDGRLLVDSSKHVFED